VECIAASDVGPFQISIETRGAKDVPRFISVMWNDDDDDFD
jgi:hypothetical protein